MFSSFVLIAAIAAQQSSCPFSGGETTMTTTLTSAKSTIDGAPDIVEVATKAGTFNTLLAAAEAAGLVGVLKSDGPLTVFAPSDEAFAKLPVGTVDTLLKPENKQALVSILTYHVVPGKMMAADVLKSKALNTANGQRVGISMKDNKPMVDKAAIVATDIVASNGVVHVIDNVILPEKNDIITIAGNAGTFKTLAAALTTAELVETLQGKGPFAVLAPTDEAFAKLPEGTVENLLKPENRELLKKILLYHVVPGRVYSDQVVKLKNAPTAAGINAPIMLNGKNVMVGGSKVVKTDIEASNGVIHIIDTVMLPE